MIKDYWGFWLVNSWEGVFRKRGRSYLNNYLKGIIKVKWYLDIGYLDIGKGKG